MLLFVSTYCSIVPLWQSKQVTECDWGRCSELSWHRGRTDQLWIVLYRQISPPVHAIHGVILCVCVRGKSGYYGSVLTRSTVTCVYCWLGHAAPPTPAAVRVTQKRIPADFLFGRTLLIETSVHMLRSNDESPRAMAASKSSPCWTLCEDCPRSRGNTLIWRVQASFGIKTLAVFNLSLMIWIHCSEAVILRMVSCLSTVVWSVGGFSCSPRPLQPALVLPRTSLALCCSHMLWADIWDWSCLQYTLWCCRSITGEHKRSSVPAVTVIIIHHHSHHGASQK